MFARMFACMFAMLLAAQFLQESRLSRLAAKILELHMPVTGPAHGTTRGITGNLWFGIGNPKMCLAADHMQTSWCVTCQAS